MFNAEKLLSYLAAKLQVTKQADQNSVSCSG